MIIQANFIDGFKPNSYGKLIVKLKSPVNTTVDISREKAQDFKKWILNQFFKTISLNKRNRLEIHELQ